MEQVRARILVGCGMERSTSARLPAEGHFDDVAPLLGWGVVPEAEAVRGFSGWPGTLSGRASLQVFLASMARKVQSVSLPTRPSIQTASWPSLRNWRTTSLSAPADAGHVRYP